MDPPPQPEGTPENRSPLPENQENKNKEHALVDHQSVGSTHCDEDTKDSKTLENFRTKVLEFARESRLSRANILLIERSFPDFFPELHVPDHPPYAAMIYKAIKELDEAGGSTEEAISLSIRKEQNDLPWAHATLLTHHLQKLCENGDIVVTDEKCYMLNTSCITSNHTQIEAFDPNQMEAFDPNQIVAFDPNQISASPIPVPYSSPSSSSSSYSDYTPNEKRRKQKRTGRKCGKKRRTDRRKAESEEEFEINEEENSEETEEEDDSEEYEDEEFYITEEEVEVTEVENRLIKYKGKHTHRTEGAKKNKTKIISEFKDEHTRVFPVKNLVNGTSDRETKLARGRGRPPKYPKPKTFIGPKEARMELIETHNQAGEVAKRLKQKRGRGRPPKNIGFETETRPEETQEQLLETNNQLRGVLNRPKQSRERSSPKEIRTDADIAPKEVDKEVMETYNQATEDLKRLRDRRGRGRPPKNLGNETNIGQKEEQGKIIDGYDQLDGMEKPKQKRRPGRPSKNSGGQIVVSEVHNQTTEDGMKVKQGRRRLRRKHEIIEANTYLDQLELTVLQEMFESMKIRSCDDGENVYAAVSPSSPCKSCEPAMEDKKKKEREKQIQSSVRGVELFDKHDWTKIPERSQILDDVEKLSGTPIQLPQEGTEDEAYPCQLQLQAGKSKTDEYTTMKETAPSQVVHEEQQSGCLGQGGPPGFEHVTTMAPLTVSSDQHEDAGQQKILAGKTQLLETEEEASTFLELLQSEYKYINDEQLDQPKKQSCGVSGKPTYSTRENDKSSDCQN